MAQLGGGRWKTDLTTTSDFCLSPGYAHHYHYAPSPSPPHTHTHYLVTVKICPTLLLSLLTSFCFISMWTNAYFYTCRTAKEEAVEFECNRRILIGVLLNSIIVIVRVHKNYILVPLYSVVQREQKPTKTKWAEANKLFPSFVKSPKKKRKKKRKKKEKKRKHVTILWSQYTHKLSCCDVYWLFPTLKIATIISSATCFSCVFPVSPTHRFSHVWLLNAIVKIERPPHPPCIYFFFIRKEYWTKKKLRIKKRKNSFCRKKVTKGSFSTNSVKDVNFYW